MKKYILFLMMFFMILGCGGGGSVKEHIKEWKNIKIVFSNLKEVGNMVSATNEKGDVVAIWFEKKANNKYGLSGAVYYTSLKEWKRLNLFTQSDNLRENAPIRVAINEKGDILVASLDDNKKNLYAYFYDKENNQWKRKVVDNLDRSITKYQVALANKKGFVAWLQYDGSAYSLYASVYTINSNSWSIPTRKEGATKDIKDLALTSYGDDKAMLTWIEYNGKIYYRYYDTNWHTITNLIDSEKFRVFLIQKQNKNGDGVLFWADEVGVNTYYNYFYFFNQNSWLTLSDPINFYEGVLLYYSAKGDMLLGNEDYLKIYNHNTKSWSSLINYSGLSWWHIDFALDESLNIFICWIESKGSQKRLMVKIYDNKKQQFSNVQELALAKDIRGGDVIVKDEKAKVIWLQTDETNKVSFCEANYE